MTIEMTELKKELEVSFSLHSFQLEWLEYYYGAGYLQEEPMVTVKRGSDGAIVFHVIVPEVIVPEEVVPEEEV